MIFGTMIACIHVTGLLRRQGQDQALDRFLDQEKDIIQNNMLKPFPFAILGTNYILSICIGGSISNLKEKSYSQSGFGWDYYHYTIIYGVKQGEFIPQWAECSKHL